MKSTNNNEGYAEWIKYQDSLKPYFKENKIPLSGTLELTPLCNFKCNMCYVRLNPDKVGCYGKIHTAEQWIDLAKQIKNSGTLLLELTGGEVFAKPDFRQIYETLYDMGFLLVLRTNGYLVNPKVISWLSKRKPYFMSITIYGASDETYNTVCEIKNGFTVVSQNIRAMKEAKIPFKTTMTLTKDNYDDLPKVTKWAKDNDVVFGGGFAGLFGTREETGRSIEEKRIDSVDDIGNLQEEDVVIPKDYFFDEHPFSKCRNFGTRFSISWNWHMTICNTMVSRYENLDEASSFLTSYRRLLDCMNALKRPAECMNCKYDPFCPNCPALLDAETGNPEVKNDKVCMQAKLRYKRYMKA